MANTIPSLKDGEQTVFFQAGGEWCYLRTPANYRSDSSSGSPVPCVVHCHGNRGYVRNGEADWLDDDTKALFVRALIDTGIAVAESHATGNHFGRPSAVAANGVLFNALVEQTNLDSERMGLMGGGLGAALAWNSVTGPLAGQVRAAVLQQGSLSIESMVRYKGFDAKTLILVEGFNIPADTADDLAIATLAHEDPLTRTQMLVNQEGSNAANLLPEVLFVHGDADDHMLFEENPVALSKVLDSCGAKYSFQVYKGIGHATYDLGETAARDVTNFFKKTFAL